MKELQREFSCFYFSGSSQSDDQRTGLRKANPRTCSFLGGPTSLFIGIKRGLYPYLKLDDEHIIAPNHSHLFAAIGSALNSKRNVDIPLQTLQSRLANKIELEFEVERLEPLFASSADYEEFTFRHAKHQVPVKTLLLTRERLFLESMQVPLQQRQHW